MVHLEDIHSLSDFQRNTKEHIQRLKETGRPEVLTVNGKAEIVVQDAASYQKLLELIDREKLSKVSRRVWSPCSAAKGNRRKKSLRDCGRNIISHMTHDLPRHHSTASRSGNRGGVSVETRQCPSSRRALVCGNRRDNQFLDQFPARCPLAPENEHFTQEIRQLLYGPRNDVYRILFTIQGDTVHVLHDRHGAQQHLTEE